MRCVACRHHWRDPEDKLSAHGFGRCRLLPAWQYRAEGATACHYTPSRHEPLSPPPRGEGETLGAAA
ncbi:MAG: hypothetical protein HYU77_13770 [Betaproteobacteria bacterium]|nr:hypothetical protein [Betaproteobacteria bacterium]